METMKCFKDDAPFSSQCLMYPLVYGFSSTAPLPCINEHEIEEPTAQQPHLLRYMGLETDLIYKVYEIPGEAPKKCALFTIQDRAASSFPSEEVFEEKTKQLARYRTTLTNLVLNQGDKRQVSSLTEKIKDLIVKHAFHFKLDTKTNFGYFLELLEVYCAEILSFLQLKAHQGPLQQSKYKELFCNLLYCLIPAEGNEKTRSAYMKSARQLVMHILLQIQD